MNLKENSAGLIAQIGTLTRPKVKEGQSVNFDAIIQNYQQGQKWSEIKELLKQKKWEKMYDESRRKELANVLNPG